MKKIFGIAALALFSLSTFAQNFATGASKKDYGRFYGNINVGTISTDYWDEDIEEDDIPTSVTGAGMGVGYVQAINLTGRKLPLFLEVGGEMNFMYYSKEHSYESRSRKETTEGSLTALNIAVPVNATYHFALANGHITLAPFMGLNFKFNVIGHGSAEEKIEYYNSSREPKSEKETYNVFDKDDMGGSDHTAKRFQIGMNIGANAYFGNFMVGYRFQPDLSDYLTLDDSELPKAIHVTTNTHFLTVGVKF